MKRINLIDNIYKLKISSLYKYTNVIKRLYMEDISIYKSIRFSGVDSLEPLVYINADLYHILQS